jgi:hypothetical protein
MRQIIGCGMGLALFMIAGTFQDEKPVARAGDEKAKTDKAPWAPAVKPKPLSENVAKGLEWLVRQQQDNGGWAQGEESAQMGRPSGQVKDAPNVGDTCAAILALIRSGSTPKEGPHKDNVRKGLDFVCKSIEGSDGKDLYVTSARGTRLQQKLGNYIDTFLASMVLAEVKEQMADEGGRTRVLEALETVVSKIQRNQKADGTFGETGWANSLSTAVASKGLNRAAQAGAPVAMVALDRAQAEGQRGFGKDGRFDAGASAGVDLYANASSLTKMRESSNTYRANGDELRRKLNDDKTPAEKKEEIRKTIQSYEDNEKILAAAQQATVQKLNDPRFIAGFGSNGGEEFLSHMNIGESLVVDGGKAWEEWDKKMTENLNRIQNADGSWTGHHCITGRTFCTSAALLCLMVDRAPVPLAAKMERK